jgi:6-phosphogluconolactonase/glucosamine-6-phosphate isomerase/deaminase
MFAQLAHHDLPWGSVRIYQVDERVAPGSLPHE